MDSCTGDFLLIPLRTQNVEVLVIGTGTARGRLRKAFFYVLTRLELEKKAITPPLPPAAISSHPP